MPLDYDKIIGHDFDEIRETYTDKDTMLYALGIGLGTDPLDAEQLDFVYEKDLKALPTQACVMGWVATADQPDFGIDRKMIVHGAQKIVLHKPLPPAADIICRLNVGEVIDKGADKGALIYYEREIFEAASGAALASVFSTIFARGDGGFGGQSGPTPPVHQVPEGAPETVCDIPTLPQMALIYRLSGDRNPLHADPERATSVGFEKPILHGLGTFGVVGHALLKTYCGYDTAKFKSMEGRFSKPVFPGETVRTEMWRDGNVVSFQARVVERDIVVMANGKAEIEG